MSKMKNNLRTMKCDNCFKILGMAAFTANETQGYCGGCANEMGFEVDNV